MSTELLDRLGEPFPQAALKQRAAPGGRTFTYLEGHAVIRRLNACLPNGWSFRVLSTEFKPWGQTNAGRPQYLVLATVELDIPSLGTRSHVGVQVVSEGAGEDLFKGAVTDGLKKAATLFGVGLELYGTDYEAVDQMTGEIAPARAAQPQRQAPPQEQRPQPSNTALISEKQIPYLWALAGERGQDEEAVHAECFRRWSEEKGWTSVVDVSVKDLTRKEGSAIIDWLKDLTVETERPIRQEPQKGFAGELAGMPEPAPEEPAWIWDAP